MDQIYPGILKTSVNEKKNDHVIRGFIEGAKRFPKLLVGWE